VTEAMVLILDAAAPVVQPGEASLMRLLTENINDCNLWVYHPREFTHQ